MAGTLGDKILKEQHLDLPDIYKKGSLFQRFQLVQLRHLALSLKTWSQIVQKEV